MFQNLRQGNSIYILNKVGRISVNVAEVISIGALTPQFSANYQPNGNFAPPKNVIDVKVAYDGKTIDLQRLPADCAIADFGENGMVVSTSKEAILSELSTLKNNSQRVLDSVDKHKENIEVCDKLIEELNPERRKEKELNKEISNLKTEISGLKDALAQFINLKKTE